MSGAPEQLAMRLHLLLTLGPAAGLAGDHDRATRCHQEILQITEPRGESDYQSLALWGARAR